MFFNDDNIIVDIRIDFLYCIADDVNIASAHIVSDLSWRKCLIF